MTVPFPSGSIADSVEAGEVTAGFGGSDDVVGGDAELDAGEADLFELDSFFGKDFDGTLDESRWVGPLGELWREAMRRMNTTVEAAGADPFVASQREGLFLDAGLTHVEVDRVIPSILPDGTKGQLLQFSLQMTRTMCDLSDMSDEDLDALSQSLPTGEFVQTGHRVVVASGQRPA